VEGITVGVSTSETVTGGPGSKPDQNYVGEENMQDYVWRNLFVY